MPSADVPARLGRCCWWRLRMQNFREIQTILPMRRPFARKEFATVWQSFWSFTLTAVVRVFVDFVELIGLQSTCLSSSVAMLAAMTRPPEDVQHGMCSENVYIGS